MPKFILSSSEFTLVIPHPSQCVHTRTSHEFLQVRPVRRSVYTYECDTFRHKLKLGSNLHTGHSNCKRHRYRYYPHSVAISQKFPCFFCVFTKPWDRLKLNEVLFACVRPVLVLSGGTKLHFTEGVHRRGCLSITIFIAASVCKLCFQLSTHGTSLVHLIGCAHGYRLST